MCVCVCVCVCARHGAPCGNHQTPLTPLTAHFCYNLKNWGSLELFPQRVVVKEEPFMGLFMCL